LHLQLPACLDGLLPTLFFGGQLSTSCHPTISVKALKVTRSTDPNQWSGFILSSSNNGLLREAAKGKSCSLTVSMYTTFVLLQDAGVDKTSERFLSTVNYTVFREIR